MIFTRLDWLIAWRHLRMGDQPPAWVRPLISVAAYLIIVGSLMATHAAFLEQAETMVMGPMGPIEDPVGSPLAQYYGAFGGLTLMVGLMALLFGLLSLFFNLLPTIITMSVLLGCMALVVVLSLMSGLEGDLRDKILAQKAHIRVSRVDGGPFDDYQALTDAIAQSEGVMGASPYLEGEIMVRSGLNRQGALLSGIIPEQLKTASNLHTLVQEGDYTYLDDPAGIPDPDPFARASDGTPWRLRHLEKDDPDDEDPTPRSKLPSIVGDDDADDADDEGTDGTGLPELRLDPIRGIDIEGLGDDDEGWEDPALEIPKLRDGGGLPPLPPPPPIEPDLEDGWEDPAQEIPKLRDDGTLPRKPDPIEPPPSAVPDPQFSTPEQPDDVEPPDAVHPILIGRELSMELGVGLGAPVQLITPIGRMTPAGRIPGTLSATVGGVFFSGMYEYDRKNVYAPLATVQKFLLVGDRVTGIEVRLRDVDNIDDGKSIVQSVVSTAGRTDELMVEDWRDLNRNLFSAMFLEKVAMFIALLFVVLVASFGILASNLMSVMEKAKEIAILKAMGTADTGILRVFIAEGLCVGILGSFGGIAMGLGLCWALDNFGLPLNENVYYIEKLPVVVNPWEVAAVGVAALVIVCFSSLYPALVASRLRPVDGLRHADQ